MERPRFLTLGTITIRSGNEIVEEIHVVNISDSDIGMIVAAIKGDERLDPKCLCFRNGAIVAPEKVVALGMIGDDIRFLPTRGFATGEYMFEMEIIENG